MVFRALHFAFAFAVQVVLVQSLLSSRQNTIPNVPAQCQSTCDPVNEAIGAAGGCTLQDCCNKTFESNYYNCILCVGKSVNLTDWTVPQGYVDTIVTECSIEAGVNLPKLTFPGQNPNRTLSTLSLPTSTAASTTGNGTASHSATTTSHSQVTITAPLNLSTSSNPQSTVTVGPSPTQANAPNAASKFVANVCLVWIIIIYAITMLY